MKQRDPVGDAANSTDADVRLHGQAAQALKAAGIVVVSFSRYAPDYGAKAG